jgi:hypothetical protein
MTDLLGPACGDHHRLHNADDVASAHFLCAPSQIRSRSFRKGLPRNTAAVFATCLDRSVTARLVAAMHTRVPRQVRMLCWPEHHVVHESACATGAATNVALLGTACPAEPFLLFSIGLRLLEFRHPAPMQGDAATPRRITLGPRPFGRSMAAPTVLDRRPSPPARQQRSR